jgi:hypothetical protein
LESGSFGIREGARLLITASLNFSSKPAMAFKRMLDLLDVENTHEELHTIVVIK